MDAIRRTWPVFRHSLSCDIKFRAAAEIDISRDSLGVERASRELNRHLRIALVLDAL